MRERLPGVVATLWMATAVVIAILAANTAHFSPRDFIIPAADPATWLLPLTLTGTPILLIASRIVAQPLAGILPWIALTLLMLPIAVACSIFAFPKETGYYDLEDPARQAGGMPQ